MNGVTINGKHSLDDFGLYLQPKSIPMPEAKTTAVEIEGADGAIDLSTALTDGNIRYKNRTLELDFACIGFGEKTDAAIERFMHNVHGKTVDLVFDDDPDHYFTGRCEVTKREYKNGYVLIACEVSVEPYRYDVELTKVSKSIDGTGVMSVSNARQWVVPTITATAEMTLQYQGTLYQVTEGRHVISNIVLRDGVNTLTFSGTGTVTIEYRQGVL